MKKRSEIESEKEDFKWGYRVVGKNLGCIAAARPARVNSAKVSHVNFVKILLLLWFLATDKG